ncbi:hypothetical protein M7I_5460 [Glarea lozoyensis 74030]|uniref:Uncharacterized protein n=1 Tax=Glarea lozoyensis (strain ATCC 74030 / MF5533) TaxID=1104152 RepID=H0ERY8_GLAL7|nr:hypothetical protein M7I_5460 [Glarea lozoyensis 74030]
MYSEAPSYGDLNERTPTGQPSDASQIRLLTGQEDTRPYVLGDSVVSVSMNQIIGSTGLDGVVPEPLKIIPTFGILITLASAFDYRYGTTTQPIRKHICSILEQWKNLTYTIMESE